MGVCLIRRPPQATPHPCIDTHTHMEHTLTGHTVTHGTHTADPSRLGMWCGLGWSVNETHIPVYSFFLIRRHPKGSWGLGVVSERDSHPPSFPFPHSPTPSTLEFILFWDIPPSPPTSRGCRRSFVCFGGPCLRKGAKDNRFAAVRRSDAPDLLAAVLPRCQTSLRDVGSLRHCGCHCLSTGLQQPLQK